MIYQIEELQGKELEPKMDFVSNRLQISVILKKIEANFDQLTPEERELFADFSQRLCDELDEMIEQIPAIKEYY